MRLVIWGVVGEDGGPVEGTIVLGKVQLLMMVSISLGPFWGDARVSADPAFVADTLGAFSANSNTNYIGGGVEQTLAHLLELDVAHGRGEVVNRHGRDERRVFDNGASSFSGQ